MTPNAMSSDTKATVPTPTPTPTPIPPKSITLYRGFPPSPTFTPSPFVSKLEFCLRLAHLPHTLAAGSPLKAPRGKIPYASIPTSNASTSITTDTMLGDSGLIARKLEAEGLLTDLNKGLDAGMKARDVALRALLEDRLYWFHYYEMWIPNFHHMRDIVLWSLPYAAKVLAGLFLWRSVSAAVDAQGTARYSAEEIYAFRREIWEGLDALLAQSRGKSKGEGIEGTGKLFWVFGGMEPTEADTSLFGTVVAALAAEAAPEAKRLVESMPNVMAYACAIRDQYFGDYTLGTYRAGA